MLRWLRKFRLRLPIPRKISLPARFILALGYLSVVASVVVIHFVDKGETAWLAWALIALITVSSVVRSVPAYDSLVLLFAIASYGGFQIYRTVQGANYFAEAFGGVFAFVLVAWFTRALTQRLSAIEQEVEHNVILIDELTSRDDITGAIKRTHAHQLLTEEVQRSRRYNHSLSLMVIDTDELEVVRTEKGAPEAARMLGLLGELLVRILRNVDLLSRHHDLQFAVILPETRLDGARRVAQKICQAATDELHITIRAGIAEFPGDAVSSEDLVAEAEAALEFSKTAALRITDRTLIS